MADSVKVSDSAQIEGPYGSAHLRPDDDGPLVLIAGSSGLAPAKSIARTALLRQPERRVHLYFGVRDEGHVYDERAFQVLVSRYGNLRVDTVLSEPAGETGRRRGTLADALLEDLSAHRGARFYVAGPPEMVSSVTAAISGSGLGREQIHAAPFHVTGQDAAAETTGPAQAGHVGRERKRARWGKRGGV